MKIVLLVGSYNLGGAEYHAFKLAKYFKQKNIDTEFWVFKDNDGPSKKMCEAAGIGTKVIPHIKNFGKGFAYFKQLLFYVRLLRKEKVDVLISFNFTQNIWNGLVGKLGGVKCTVWSQQSEFKEDWNFPYSKKAVKKINCFISNAQHVSEKLYQSLPVARSKKDFHVVYNGIEQRSQNETDAYWEKTLDKKDYQFIASMVANLTYTKDHLTLVKAWKIVVEKCLANNCKPLLVFAGRKGDTFDAINQLIIDNQLQDYIKILGMVSDIPGLNSHSDLGILSSNAEGLPNAVMEQMLCGLPVIGTNNDGTKEALGEAMFSYLNSPSDANQLAEKILFFINNPKIRNEVGLINKSRIQSQFSFDMMGDSTLKIVKKYL